jgi:hypothetical protein
MEKQMESQTNKVGNFLTKMDYRTAIFSLLFLVIGFIAGLHLHKGPHHMSCGQFRREQLMGERAPSFDRGKDEREGGKEFPPPRKHPNYEFKKGMEPEGEKRPNEEKPPAPEKNNDNPE